MIYRTDAIEKILSRNDTGETGGHQAGILIPKKNEIITFFPSLDSNERNPRYKMNIYDHLGDKWTFSFIYYNNKFFGGTRNEFRLTGMTRYLNAYNLRAGDTLTLSRDNDGLYYVKYTKGDTQLGENGMLILRDSWKVVRI